jgi:lysozyme
VAERRETLKERRDRLNRESIALRATIKKKRVRLRKVLAGLRRANAALRRRIGRGIDVSEHQGAVDFAAVKRSGETWTGVKATEGRDFTDERFARNLREAQRAELRIAPYHFARPDTHGGTPEDARAEAAHFVRTVTLAGGRFVAPKDWIAGRDGVLGVLDFEHEPFSATWAAAWAQHFTQLTGVRPVVYGFGASLNPIANAVERWFAWVWFAAFVDDWRPFCLDSLEDNVRAWQWTGSGTVAGVSGRVDRNRWLG